MNPNSLPKKWLEPIGEDLALHPEVVGIDPPATITEFTDLTIGLREKLNGVWPVVKTSEFNPDDYRIPVKIGWHSPFGVLWGGRDVVGLSPEGSQPPPMPANAKLTSVPGTWVRWPRTDFQDRVLLIEYTINLNEPVDGILMFNCSEHVRLWLNGEYLFGSGPGWMFPTQHRPPVGQSKDVQLTAGKHTLLAMILRPSEDRDHAEWIVGLAKQPTMEWVPHALRPQQQSS